MTNRKLVLHGIVILLFALIVIVSADAQDTGQICVRAFIDLNGSGTIEAGEPLLSSGIVAILLDESGTTEIARGAMEDSLTSAQGVICFQFLPPNRYYLVIESPVFVSTTPNTMLVSLDDVALPVVVEFGAQPIALTTTPTVEPTPQDELYDFTVPDTSTPPPGFRLSTPGVFLYARNTVFLLESQSSGIALGSLGINQLTSVLQNLPQTTNNLPRILMWSPDISISDLSLIGFVGGIGATLQERGNNVIIGGPLFGGAAETAGLQVGGHVQPQDYVPG